MKLRCIGLFVEYYEISDIYYISTLTSIPKSSHLRMDFDIYCFFVLNRLYSITKMILSFFLIKLRLLYRFVFPLQCIN